jgi:hypothetical protein
MSGRQTGVNVAQAVAFEQANVLARFFQEIRSRDASDAAADDDHIELLGFRHFAELGAFGALPEGFRFQLCWVRLIGTHGKTPSR